MTESAAPTGKPPASHPRPLPPTPGIPKTAAVAKAALKPAPPRVSSIYLLEKRKSCDLTLPKTPTELSEKITEWVTKAIDAEPTKKAEYIANARKTLDELLAQTLHCHNDELQELWMTQIEIGYTLLASFTKLQNTETSDSRFVDLCKRIKEHRTLQEKGQENLEQTEEIKPPALPSKNTDYFNLRTISMIAAAILSLVGLFFIVRLSMQRFIVKR